MLELYWFYINSKGELLFNKMKKKLIITFVLVAGYFFTGWVADNISFVVVNSESGLHYHIDYHFFYNQFTFYNENGTVGSGKINFRLERLFLLATSVVFVSLEIFKKFKSE